ncbi:division plane positioning ATPase MipZ [Thalassospira lucentensis]|uniref:nucleotide-binding protein n=1 Tax=Thalassospira lucentensis TaxID=168935 RepID=UPI003D266DA1
MGKDGVVVVVGGLKGGTGRTTIATNMAVKFRQLGYRTALVGIDPQEVLLKWRKVRASEGRLLVAETGRTMCHLEVYSYWESDALQSSTPDFDVQSLNDAPLRFDIEALKCLIPKFDVIIIDVGARSEEELFSVSQIADLIVSPLMLSAFDVETLPRFKKLLDQAMSCNPHLRVGFLLNEIADDATREFIYKIRGDIDKVIGGYERYFQFVQELGCREAFRETVPYGLAVNEMPVVDRDTVREFSSLFDAVTKELKDKCRSDFVVNNAYAGYWA